MKLNDCGGGNIHHDYELEFFLAYIVTSVLCSCHDSIDKRKFYYMLVRFLYDVCYYGVALFGGEILDAMSKNSAGVSSDTSVSTSSLKELIALSAGIPAVFATIYLMKIFSLKRLQMGGFGAMGCVFLAMSLFFTPLKDSHPRILFCLYCLLLFSLSFGPNVTTYVMPSTVYPIEVRSTMGGISAAVVRSPRKYKFVCNSLYCLM